MFYDEQCIIGVTILCLQTNEQLKRKAKSQANGGPTSWESRLHPNS